MKSKVMRVFAIFLVMVLAFVPVVSVYGQSTSTKYIKDIKVGYGDDGRDLLKKAGYTVWEELDANAGGYGGSVYIGYMETENATEAITKVTLMNMNGGYSYSDWVSEVESIRDDVSNLLFSLSNSIIEFQQRYDEGSEYAQNAYEMLNAIMETDTDTPLGDLLLSVSDPASDEQLNNMFLLANAQILNAVEEIIAYACTDNNEDGSTFLDRVSSRSVTGEIDYAYNYERGILLTALDNFRNYYDSILKSLDTFEKNAKAKGYDSVLDYVKTLGTDRQLEYGKYITIINNLEEIEYAGTGNSLLDIVTLKKDDPNIQYTDELFEPLLKSLTPGQLGCLRVVSFETLVLNAVGSKDGSSTESILAIEEQLFKKYDELGIESISIYYGVDRSLFEDPDTVALSSTLIREKASQNGGYFGVDKKAYASTKSNKATIALLIASAGIAVLCGGYWVCTSGAVAATEAAAADWFAEWGATEITGIVTNPKVSTAAASSSLGTTICGIVAIIALIILIVCIVLLVNGNNDNTEPETEKIDHTPIPRAIVDLMFDSEGDKYYVNYYAAKNIAAGKTETDSLKLYGDLNGMNDYDQWLAVYYTKDTRVGTPLTTEIFISQKSEVKDGYQAIGELGFDGASDLNKYTHSASKKPVYFYIKEAVVATQTASVFSNGFVGGIAISSFFVGAATASIITYKKTRKRYEH